MGVATSFEDMEVWQVSRKLASKVYDVTERGRFSRDFALRDQIRRAAISTMSNIAEGFESRTNRLFVDLLGRAKASAAEVRSQMYLALDRAYVDHQSFNLIVEDTQVVCRQIRRLTQYLERVGDAVRAREP